MGVFSDVTEEFRKAPGKERALIIIGVVVTIGVAYYLYTKQQATGTQAAIGQKSGTEANQPTGYPITTGGTPTIPYGTQPLYSPSGDLVAFQTGQTGGGSAPSPFTWPAALSGMKLWQGTQTKKYWYGPNGPQHGQTGQTELSTLFPSGTVFSGSTGHDLFYTLPGSGTAVDSGIKLVNPLPPSQTTTANNAARITH